MTFKNILVTLDGSKYSQIAAEYGFWLASSSNAKLTGMHVLDPRLVDLFIAPEFAESLGFSRSVDTAEKVFNALRRIGKVILELFATEAIGRGLKSTTILAEGYIIEEILKEVDDYDLVIVGHRGQGQKQVPSELMIGSIAERIAVHCDKPVLVCATPLTELKRILVAYDGSESATGALLMAESLAKSCNLQLKAITVVPSSKDRAGAHLLIEQGRSYLREKWDDEVFSIEEGAVAPIILDYAKVTDSLLVLGAYGYKNPDDNILGSTTTKVVRDAKTSILIFKPLSQKQTNRLEDLQEIASP